MVLLTCLLLAFAVAEDSQGQGLQITILPEVLTSSSMVDTRIMGADPGSLPLMFYGSTLALAGTGPLMLDINPIGSQILPIIPPSGGYTLPATMPIDIADLCGDRVYFQLVTFLPIPGGGLHTEKSNLRFVDFDCVFCPSAGPPSIVALEFTGADCTASNNSQGTAAQCFNLGPNFVGPVRIVARSAGSPPRTWFSGIVDLGNTIIIDAANGIPSPEPDLGSDVFLSVFQINGSLIQEVNFRLDCSVPLSADDHFGAFRVQGVVFP
jgi:hypothetical protein